MFFSADEPPSANLVVAGAFLTHASSCWVSCKTAWPIPSGAFRVLNKKSAGYEAAIAAPIDPRAPSLRSMPGMLGRFSDFIHQSFDAPVGLLTPMTATASSLVISRRNFFYTFFSIIRLCRIGHETCVSSAALCLTSSAMSIGDAPKERSHSRSEIYCSLPAIPILNHTAKCQEPFPTSLLILTHFNNRL